MVDLTLNRRYDRHAPCVTNRIHTLHLMYDISNLPDTWQASQPLPSAWPEEPPVADKQIFVTASTPPFQKLGCLLQAEITARVMKCRHELFSVCHLDGDVFWLLLLVHSVGCTVMHSRQDSGQTGAGSVPWFFL